jgi:hypothetical protein
MIVGVDVGGRELMEGAGADGRAVVTEHEKKIRPVEPDPFTSTACNGSAQERI